MNNFAADIERAAAGEPIQAVVVGAYGWGREWDVDEDVPVRRGPLPPLGQPVAWADARAALDYEYDAGFGGPECDAIWAWTASRVLFVTQSRGATQVQWLPRDPSAGEPLMFGHS